MKKFFALLLIIAAIISLSVNLPRQILLFYNLKLPSISNAPEDLAKSLQNAAYFGIDPITNIPSIYSRFSLMLDATSTIKNVEFAVIAARMLGIENEVMDTYLLKTPSFRSIRTEMEEKYVKESYDFSRNFGYIEFLQKFFMENFGYPLLDTTDPFEPLTKLEVVKYSVKLFDALSKMKDLPWKNLVEEAEEINTWLCKRHGAMKTLDAGYVSVFERYFLVAKGDRYVSLLREFDPNFDPLKPAPKWWTMYLLWNVFGKKAGKFAGNEFVPLRTYANLISYVPESSVGYDPVKLEDRSPKVIKVQKIDSYLGTYPVIYIKGDTENAIILDNTKVNLIVNYVGVEKAPMIREELGRDFANFYASLLDKRVYDETTWLVPVRGRINQEKKAIENLEYKLAADFPKSAPLYSEVPLSKLEGAKVLVEEVEVGTVKEIMKLLQHPEMIERGEVKIISKTEVPIEKMPPHMMVDLTVQVVRKKIRQQLVKEDFNGAVVAFTPVYDRLNLKKNDATFSSIKSFSSKYEHGYEIIQPGESLDFIDYWNDIKKALSKLNCDENAKVAGKVMIKVTKDLSTKDQYSFSWAMPRLKAIKFYVGRLKQFEQATRRLVTELFVDTLTFTDDTWAYIKYKDGKVAVGKLVDHPEYFLNEEGVLRNLKLWYQIVEKDGKPIVKYIIAEEF